MYEQVYDSNYDSDSDVYVAAISSDSVHQLEPLNVEVQMGEIKTSAMIDSGSAVSIITKSLANKILRSTKSAKWTESTERRNLKTFSNESIKVIGHLETTVVYNQWQDKSAMLTVVNDGPKNIIGRDLFTTLGLARTTIGTSNNNQKLVNVFITSIILHVKLKSQSRRNFHIYYRELAYLKHM